MTAGRDFGLVTAVGRDRLTGDPPSGGRPGGSSKASTCWPDPLPWACVSDRSFHKASSSAEEGLTESGWGPLPRCAYRVRHE